MGWKDYLPGAKSRAQTQQISELQSEIKYLSTANQINTAVLNARANHSGRYDDYRSGGAKFRDGLAASGQYINLNHKLLRLNARKAMQDSVEARMIPERFADMTADRGLKLECTPDHIMLGITPEEAESWGADVESRFHAWAISKKSDRSENNTFYQNQWLYSMWQHRDNDIFPRLYYTKDTDAINPLQISFVDPDMVRSDAYTSTTGWQYGNDDGIIRDDRGRETGYKIWVKNSNNEYKDVTIQAKGPKSGRLFMLHGFRKEYAGQTRGITRLAPFLQEFENITDFSLAVIAKAINQSNTIGVIENDQQNPTDIYEELNQDRGVGIPETETPSTEQAIIDTGAEFSFRRLPESTTAIPGSEFIANMKRGDKFKHIQNTSPNEPFSQFVSQFFTHLAAGAGIPIEVVLMKFNNNYSASRATLLMFWRLLGIWKSEMESDFLNPVYSMWLSEEIASGRIQAPGWSDPRMRAAWLSCNWIGAPMPNIDPMRTMKADQGYYEMGGTTGKRIARELNGSDFKSNVARRNKEFEQLSLFPAPWQKQAGAG